MRAIVVERFGGPEMMAPREVPDPRPGPGEVVVRTGAVDVLWLDTLIRSGGAGPGMTPQLPWTPGGGVAGEVVAVGDGVEASLLGTRVTAETGPAGGGYAEQVAVPAAVLCPVPDRVTTETAAALLHDGATAVGLHDVTGVGPGDRVLVLGGSGGLGILSTQLAAARTDRVVAVARGRTKLDRLRALGSGTVVDGDRPDWTARVRDALGGPADVVLDNIGGALGATAFDDVLADGGRFSAHGCPSGSFTEADPAQVRRRGVTMTGIEAVRYAPDVRVERTAQALRAAADGTVEPVVGQRFALADAAAAHRAIEGRAVFGKTVLAVD